MMSPIGVVRGEYPWKYARGMGSYGRNFRVLWLKVGGGGEEGRRVPMGGWPVMGRVRSWAGGVCLAGYAWREDVSVEL